MALSYRFKGQVWRAWSFKPTYPIALKSTYSDVSYLLFLPHHKTQVLCPGLLRLFSNITANCIIIYLFYRSKFSKGPYNLL